MKTCIQHYDLYSFCHTRTFHFHFSHRFFSFVLCSSTFFLSFNAPAAASSADSNGRFPSLELTHEAINSASAQGYKDGSLLNLIQLLAKRQ
jgi:hypothetical protein